MHTHRTLLPNAVGGALWGHASAESTSLAVVPMFHITGMMYGVIGSVMAGLTMVLLPRWDRELAGRMISHYRVTHWTCIPTMIIDLFASPQVQAVRSVQPAVPVGRRRGHAGGRGPAPAG
jgi:fatty-acyl-CoA synthase